MVTLELTRRTFGLPLAMVAILFRIAMTLTAGFRGGPAHAAIVASALFGTMSGSVMANVVGTGGFTIPMIKKRATPDTSARLPARCRNI